MNYTAWQRFSLSLLKLWAALQGSTPDDAPDLSPEDPEALVTVATFDKSTDAHIARGRLAAEGIAAVLFDENMVQMDWLYAIALGGIKLRVRRSDEARARRVLATDYSAELEGFDPSKPPR